MAKELYYRQCHLQQQGKVRWEQTSFIPEPYCVIGKILKLRDDDGNWSDGWKVMTAGERKAARLVELQERDYLKTRIRHMKR
jgi:hypothetical protein